MRSTTFVYSSILIANTKERFFLYVQAWIQKYLEYFSHSYWSVWLTVWLGLHVAADLHCSLFTSQNHCVDKPQVRQGRVLLSWCHGWVALGLKQSWKLCFGLLSLPLLCSSPSTRVTKSKSMDFSNIFACLDGFGLFF